MEHILLPSKNLTLNRKGRRDFEKEFNRNIKDFKHCEDMFLDSIQDSDYRLCYSIYLTEWNDLVEFHNSNGIFRHTILNEHYFEKMYKPIERPCKYAFCQMLMNSVRSRFLN